MKADKISSLFWITAGLISIYGSFLLGLGTLQEPGPGFLSFLAGCFICSMATILFFQSFSLSHGFQAKVSTLWEGMKWPRPMVICLIMTGYVLALERIGFFLTSFLLFLIILKGVENLSWKKTLLIPMGTLLVSYILFHFVVKATLPQGIFGF